MLKLTVPFPQEWAMCNHALIQVRQETNGPLQTIWSTGSDQYLEKEISRQDFKY